MSQDRNRMALDLLNTAMMDFIPYLQIKVPTEVEFNTRLTAFRELLFSLAQPAVRIADLGALKKFFSENINKLTRDEKQEIDAFIKTKQAHEELKKTSFDALRTGFETSNDQVAPLKLPSVSIQSLRDAKSTARIFRFWQEAKVDVIHLPPIRSGIEADMERLKKHKNEVLKDYMQRKPLKPITAVSCRKILKR